MIKKITKKECVELLKKYEVKPNMIRHSIVVNKISNFLAKKLAEKGVEIDLDLVDKGSLLHDLDKYKTLHKHNHGTLAPIWLKKHGYPEIAVIVEKHVLSAVNNPKLRPKTWEEKIVYYADKRATHDNITSLKDRFTYLRETYGNISPDALKRINQAEPGTYKIEKEIFDKIKLSPNRLKYYMEKEKKSRKRNSSNKSSTKKRR